MIDTHAHIFLSKMKPDDYVRSAMDAGVTGIINVAINLESAALSVELARNYSMVYATAGIHPCEGGEVNPIEQLRDFVNSYSIVAIGEIGLDGYRSPLSMEDQIVRFRSQLDLAREYNLPVIIHCREAANTMAEVIMDYPDIRKVYHCFSESDAFINAVDDENTMMSFTGNITYSNAENSRHAVKTLPFAKIMLETDSPYLVPTRFKGLPNQSAYIGEVASQVAELRGVSRDTVADVTTLNAIRFFGL
ncbi:TatD family deoxyribonuclease [bacterium]|nr:TatD family deoxyribonuclease [bacterium]